MHVWTVSISLSGVNKSTWKIVLQVGCRLLTFVPLHGYFIHNSSSVLLVDHIQVELCFLITPYIPVVFTSLVFFVFMK